MAVEIPAPIVAARTNDANQLADFFIEPSQRLALFVPMVQP
jgi:hypothetical protein